MSASQPPHTIRVVTAVIKQDDKYLITQRRPNAVLPLLWEFPGGRVEEGESDAEALKRELHHRLGVEVATGEQISFKEHRFETYVVDLFLYECRIVSGQPQTCAVHAFKWVSSSDFDNHSFTPPDEASVAKLLGLTS